jgi:hypothetical protein
MNQSVPDRHGLEIVCLSGTPSIHEQLSNTMSLPEAAALWQSNRLFIEGSIPATADTGIDKINENQGDKSVNVTDNVVYLLIQVPSLLIKNIFITNVAVVVVAVVDILFCC